MSKVLKPLIVLVVIALACYGVHHHIKTKEALEARYDSIKDEAEKVGYTMTSIRSKSTDESLDADEEAIEKIKEENITNIDKIYERIEDPYKEAYDANKSEDETTNQRLITNLALLNYVDIKRDFEPKFTEGNESEDIDKAKDELNETIRMAPDFPTLKEININKLSESDVEFMKNATVGGTSSLEVVSELIDNIKSQISIINNMINYDMTGSQETLMITSEMNAAAIEQKEKEEAEERARIAKEKEEAEKEAEEEAKAEEEARDAAIKDIQSSAGHVDVSYSTDVNTYGANLVKIEGVDSGSTASAVEDSTGLRVIWPGANSYAVAYDSSLYTFEYYTYTSDSVSCVFTQGDITVGVVSGDGEFDQNLADKYDIDVMI